MFLYFSYKFDHFFKKILTEKKIKTNYNMKRRNYCLWYCYFWTTSLIRRRKKIKTTYFLAFLLRHAWFYSLCWFLWDLLTEEGRVCFCFGCIRSSWANCRTTRKASWMLCCGKCWNKSESINLKLIIAFITCIDASFRVYSNVSGWALEGQVWIWCSFQL